MGNPRSSSGESESRIRKLLLVNSAKNTTLKSSLLLPTFAIGLAKSILRIILTPKTTINYIDSYHNQILNLSWPK